MQKRGQLTDRIKEKSLELLGYEIIEKKQKKFSYFVSYSHPIGDGQLNVIRSNKIVCYADIVSLIPDMEKQVWKGVVITNYILLDK